MAAVKQAWNRMTGCPTHYFAIVVVENPETGLWLAVDESRDRGWWLPGGFVECGDDLYSTAHKETAEEAGIDIVVKGLLRMESGITTRGARFRAILYAHPKDPNQAPKSVPDDESNGASWVSIATLEEWDKQGKLRGDELLQWAKYIRNGGTIYPLSALTTEQCAVGASTYQPPK